MADKQVHDVITVGMLPADLTLHFAWEELKLH